LEVAEQDDSRHVGGVLEVVHVGLVEDEILAVPPRIPVAVDRNAAGVGVRRDEAEVIAKRARERIAVLADVATWRHRGEHRAVHRRNREHELAALRTELGRRRQWLAVPLQIETLPAPAEERVEAEVVVALGGADVAALVERDRFVADRWPVVAKTPELREIADVEDRLRRYAGE